MSNVSTPIPVPTRVKDLTVSNLSETWSADGPVSINEFFSKAERAAKSGNWTDADKQ